MCGCEGCDGCPTQAIIGRHFHLERGVGGDVEMIVPTEFGTRRICRDVDLPGQFDGEICAALIVVRWVEVE